jgi:hypothetical protein
MAKHSDNPENEGENPNDGNNGDDNFGLPDIDYKPLDSPGDSASTSSSFESNEKFDENREAGNSYSYTPAEETKSNAPVIIAVIIGLVLVVAGFLIYQYVYKPKAEKTRKEQLAKMAAEKKMKDEAARLAKEKEEAEKRRLEDEKAAAAIATPAAGTIETLNERTGRYYVVVSSAIDDDLTMDYAKKIVTDGTSIRIIPPFGKKKFYRLTIGDFDTFANAQIKADEVKSKYGDGVWVIKY